jgi:hypothetical protein
VHAYLLRRSAAHATTTPSRRSAPPRPRRAAAALALATASLALAACTSGTPSATGAARGVGSSSHLSSPTTATSAPSTTTTTEQPGWSVLSTDALGVAIDGRSFSLPDGAQVTVARFRAGRVTYDLHIGSQDPPTGQATLGPDAGPSVSAAEQPHLLACFNGGFKTDTGAGGVEVDGQTLVPLANGDASLVIDASGAGHVGVWGQGLPATGETVASVRQNLAPLVLGGQPSPQIDDVAAWGATLGGGNAVARSALGEDAHGDLLYAGSMSAVPADMAQALIDAGATVAMELDINPEWVQLDTAPSPGAPLVAGVPGQNRPANQCQVGWTRDFITVLAAG